MSDIAVEVVDPERINVGNGVSIPCAWDAVASGEPNIAGAIRMHIVFDKQLRRAVAASVTLDRAGEGDEVTSVALRDVRVQYVVAASSMRVVTVTREEGKHETFSQYLAEVKSRRDRTYQETVMEAVTLYRIASTVNLAPLKLVSEQLGVSVSTATRMMARAREAGIAEDLITRETYNRIRAREDEMSRPHILPGQDAGGPSGPSIGR